MRISGSSRSIGLEVHPTEPAQSLTQHGEVQLPFPVAGWESGKLTDVNPLILQLQPGQLDGAILEGRVPESHPLLVGGQDGHAHGRVVDGHILLGAVGGLLPRHLRDLHDGQLVGEAAVQHHVRADEPRDGVIDQDSLSLQPCNEMGTRERLCAPQEQRGYWASGSSIPLFIALASSWHG